MKIKQFAIRGGLLGILSLFLGSLLTLMPSVSVLFSGSQGVYEPENTILNLLILFGLPVYFFFFHLIPYLLSGIVVSFIADRLALNRLLMLIIVFFIAMMASLFSELLYVNILLVEYKKYLLIDYIFSVVVEICYIFPFTFLAQKIVFKKEIR